MLEQALQYASQNREQFLNELKDFLAIPSISTDPEHNVRYAKSRGMGSFTIAFHRYE